MAAAAACKLIKYYHLMNHLSIIRASSLELEAPDGTMLTALGPDVEHLLNTIKLGEVSVPSRIYIPLMEIGLLGMDQCTAFRRGEDAGEYFIASELRRHSQSRIRPRHKLAINRLTLLLNGQESEIEPISHMSTADLSYKARKLAPSLNTGKTLENSLTRQQRSMWDWMRRDLPTRNPHEEEGGLHAEQTRRGAISVTIEAARKRKYSTPMEFQDREGRNNSLKLEFEEYLKKEKAKKRKKSRGQPPLAPQLEAPEADTLEEIDRSISEISNNPIKPQGNGTPATPQQA